MTERGTLDRFFQWTWKDIFNFWTRKNFEVDDSNSRELFVNNIAFDLEIYSTRRKGWATCLGYYTCF